MTVKLEYFMYSPLACLRKREEGEILEDPVVALLVGLAKIAPGHRLSYPW